MPDAPLTPQEKFAQLREAYLSRLPTVIADIESLSARSPDPAALDELHHRLHKLAGSGGTYGFSELSEHAQSLESKVRAWIDAPSPPPEARSELAQGLARLRDAASRAVNASQ